MIHVAVVFITDGFHEFRVRQQTHMLHEGPWFRICVAVIDRDLDIHVAEILSAEPLDDVERFGCRLPLLIQPELSIETLRVDNERVAVPLARRIPQPCGWGIFRHFSSIKKDLAPEDAESLIQDRNEFGFLNDPPLSRSCDHARYALRKTQCG